MAVSDTCTFDLVPPRRPGLGDITTGTKKNRGKGAVPASFPCAEEHNQTAKQVLAASRMIALARLWVSFPAGMPTLYGFSAPGTAVTMESFTLADTATGRTTVSWPAGLLPAPNMPPRASSVGGLATIGVTRLSATSCLVETKNLAPAFADIDFELEIF